MLHPHNSEFSIDQARDAQDEIDTKLHRKESLEFKL
jgi:hypothetical protein